MKKAICIIFLLSCFVDGRTQSCSYAGGPCQSGLQNPTPLAIKVVGDVCSVLGIRYITIYQGNVPNACASVYMGMPIISYNYRFLNYLSAQNSWAPVSVIAHEVGHHFNADATMLGAFKHPWSKELKADFISGYALYKLGASLSDAQSAFQVMFDWYGSATHPDTPRRMAALEQGWLQASNGF